MNSSNSNDERLKLHEAVAVTALVAFAAFSVTLTVAALAARCVVVDAIDHFKKKRKGGTHVQ